MTGPWDTETTAIQSLPKQTAFHGNLRFRKLHPLYLVKDGESNLFQVELVRDVLPNCIAKADGSGITVAQS